MYFTQFKVEVRGAEIEYGMAYVSVTCTWGGCLAGPPWTATWRPRGGAGGSEEMDTKPLAGGLVARGAGVTVPRGEPG